jgi:hypothetical protein
MTGHKRGAWIRRGSVALTARARGWLTVRRDVAELTRRVGDLDGELTLIGPALIGTGAGRSAEQALHQATARRYRQFVSQDLMVAVRRAAQQPGPASGAERTRWSAEVAREICASMFALPVASRAALGDVLAALGSAGEAMADELAGTASRLRQDVAVMPASPWQFGCVAGTRLDATYQDPWADCDPAAPAQWVVAPAYVAEGQVIVKQQVYTSASPGPAR